MSTVKALVGVGGVKGVQPINEQVTRAEGA